MDKLIKDVFLSDILSHIVKYINIKDYIHLLKTSKSLYIKVKQIEMEIYNPKYKYLNIEKIYSDLFNNKSDYSISYQYYKIHRYLNYNIFSFYDLIHKPINVYNILISDNSLLIKSFNKVYSLIDEIENDDEEFLKNLYFNTYEYSIKYKDFLDIEFLQEIRFYLKSSYKHLFIKNNITIKNYNDLGKYIVIEPIISKTEILNIIYDIVNGF